MEGMNMCLYTLAFVRGCPVVARVFYGLPGENDRTMGERDQAVGRLE